MGMKLNYGFGEGWAQVLIQKDQINLVLLHIDWASNSGMVGVGERKKKAQEKHKEQKEKLKEEKWRERYIRA